MGHDSPRRYAGEPDSSYDRTARDTRTRGRIQQRAHFAIDQVDATVPPPAPIGAVTPVSIEAAYWQRQIPLLTGKDDLDLDDPPIEALSTDYETIERIIARATGTKWDPRHPDRYIIRMRAPVTAVYDERENPRGTVDDFEHAQRHSLGAFGATARKSLSAKRLMRDHGSLAAVLWLLSIAWEGSAVVTIEDAQGEVTSHVL